MSNAVVMINEQRWQEQLANKQGRSSLSPTVIEVEKRRDEVQSFQGPACPDRSNLTLHSRLGRNLVSQFTIWNRESLFYRDTGSLIVNHESRITNHESRITMV